MTHNPASNPSVDSDSQITEVIKAADILHIQRDRGKCELYERYRRYKRTQMKLLQIKNKILGIKNTLA